MRGEKIPPGMPAACVCQPCGWRSLARRHLPVGVCSPICLCTGVSSGGGALHASPSSVCQAGILEAGWQRRPALEESKAVERGSSHAWELSVLSAVGRWEGKLGGCSTSDQSSGCVDHKASTDRTAATTVVTCPVNPQSPFLSPLSFSVLPLPPPLSRCLLSAPRAP